MPDHNMVLTIVIVVLFCLLTACTKPFDTCPPLPAYSGCFYEEYPQYLPQPKNGKIEDV